MEYETGASTPQANDLVLSVLNNGSIYETRKHCGFAMLQGTSHGNYTFTSLVKNEAKTQRVKFGSKFKPQHITEAADLIKSATLAHCFEIIAGSWNGQYISAICRRWWDKTAGNSYFSICLIIPTDSGSMTLNVPFQYGYGSHWEYVTVDTLRIIGFDFPKTDYLQELPIHFTDEGCHKKSQAFKGVYISSM